MIAIILSVSLLASPAPASRPAATPAPAGTPAPATTGANPSVPAPPPEGTEAPAPDAKAGGEAKAGRESEDVTHYSFTGLGIDGELRTPALLQFLSRIGGEFETSGVPHRSFMPELQRTRVTEDVL